MKSRTCRTSHSSSQDGLESWCADLGDAEIESCMQDPNTPGLVICGGTVDECSITYLGPNTLQDSTAPSTTTATAFDELDQAQVVCTSTWTGKEIVYAITNTSGSDLTVDWPWTPVSGRVVADGEVAELTVPAPGTRAAAFPMVSFTDDLGDEVLALDTTLIPWLNAPEQPIVVRLTEFLPDGTDRVAAEVLISTQGTGGIVCCEGLPCPCREPDDVADCLGDCPPDVGSKLPSVCQCQRTTSLGALSLTAGSTLLAVIDPDETHLELPDGAPFNNEVPAVVPSSWNRTVTGISLMPGPDPELFTVGFHAAVQVLLVRGEEVDLSGDYALLVNGSPMGLAPVRSLLVTGTGTCTNGDGASCVGSCLPVEWDGLLVNGSCERRNGQCQCHYDTDKCCLAEDIRLFYGDQLTVCVSPPPGAAEEPFAGDDCLTTVFCPADLDGNGAVDVDDLTMVILGWGGADPAADINQDGAVNVDDLTELLLHWGPCLPEG
jgi:hypothetical protein